MAGLNFTERMLLYMVQLSYDREWELRFVGWWSRDRGWKLRFVGFRSVGRSSFEQCAIVQHRRSCFLFAFFVFGLFKPF